MAIIILEWDLSAARGVLIRIYTFQIDQEYNFRETIIVKWEPISGQSCIQLIVRNVDFFPFCLLSFYPSHWHPIWIIFHKCSIILPKQPLLWSDVMPEVLKKISSNWHTVSLRAIEDFDKQINHHRYWIWI